MITIKEIAEKAKVSAGTVDRVLHNRGGVSKKTEESVKRVLKENNFTLNVIASRLASRKKYHIATLIPKHNSSNLFWKSPLLGILEAAKEVEEYGVKVTNFLYEQVSQSSYIEEGNNLIHTKPDAVVIAPTFYDETKDIVTRLEEKNIPYLFLNIDLKGFKNLSFIGQNSFDGGYLAGKLMHLSTGGKHQILIVQTHLQDHNYHVTKKRIEGFTSYYKDQGTNLEIVHFNLHSLENKSFVKEGLHSVFSAHPHINGIYVPSSRISTIANEIDSQRLNQIRMIGYDTTAPNLQSLKEDKITFLISQKSFHQGYQAVLCFSDLFIKKTLPLSRIYSPLEIITKENISYGKGYKKGRPL
ncbi:LacI family transcriptional regulator [Arenibacter nanhaiticus]|uniref:LacI family transcriptional regulator n=1 Tax=Arenibacter nanhaiticus TaxID=558155 RepID=A0A1M6GXH4_9FLAO|nr:substrate-binding domain-containing protein [Arenibacter nanhaiticus]SHJ14600.1 LacI family transcriptional regulator [Arenibacter nanhaiticus]